VTNPPEDCFYATPPGGIGWQGHFGPDITDVGRKWRSQERNGTANCSNARVTGRRVSRPHNWE
jgi:hypothetical protein